MDIPRQIVRSGFATLAACFLGLLTSSAARTQGAAAMPPAPAVPQMLKSADFMIALGRPYDSAKLYRTVLKQDPDNAEAQAGLRRALGAERPEVTVLFHNYQNDLGPHSHLVTYGIGPTFHTPSGDISLSVGDGDYRQAGMHLRRSDLSLTADPRFKNGDFYLYMGGIKHYGEAPDEFLYDARLSYLPQPSRERFTLISEREESSVDSSSFQYWAPDSIFSIKEGLILQETGFEIEHGIGDRIDVLPSYSYYAYSDGNGRNVANLQLLYRILPSPKQAMPLFRVGLQYQYDGTNHAAKTYFAPVNYQSLSLAANYTQLTRRLSYGIVGSLPVTGESGSLGGRYGPAKRLYTFANYHVTDSAELWLKFTDTSAPHGSPSITDFIFGVSQRI